MGIMNNAAGGGEAASRRRSKVETIKAAVVKNELYTLDGETIRKFDSVAGHFTTCFSGGPKARAIKSAYTAGRTRTVRIFRGN